MERLDNLISEIHTTFNDKWFTDSKKLFRNHPAKKKHKVIVKFSSLSENDDWIEKEVTLYDFLNGERDQCTDENFDEMEEHKLEQIGEYEYRVREGMVYKTSDKFYPNPTYKSYCNTIMDVLEKMLKSVLAFNDKRKIIAYAKNHLTDQLMYLKPSPSTDSNNTFIKEILERIETKYVYFDEVAEVLNSNQDFIHLNLKTAELARLYQYLFGKQIIKTPKKDFLNFACQYIKIPGRDNKNPLVNKDSLDSEIKSLTSDKSKQYNSWKEEQKLDLKYNNCSEE